MSRKKSKYIVIPGKGDPCPRCGRPTQIREHAAITDKYLAQPFYYSRWFNCVHDDCKTTLIMPPRYVVVNEHQKAKEVAEAAETGKVVWGDSWDDSNTSGPPPWEE
jgi:rRNA maturation protein Nop10